MRRRLGSTPYRQSNAHCPWVTRIASTAARQGRLWPPVIWNTEFGPGQVQSVSLYPRTTETVVGLPATSEIGGTGRLCAEAAASTCLSL